MVYWVEGGNVPPAFTCTPGPGFAAVPAANDTIPFVASSLLDLPSPSTLTRKVELAPKLTLPSTVKVPIAVPATAPGDIVPPLNTPTPPLIVPCPTSRPPEFTATAPVSCAPEWEGPPSPTSNTAPSSIVVSPTRESPFKTQKLLACTFTDVKSKKLLLAVALP